MKTKIQKTRNKSGKAGKNYDAVKSMREIRDKISLEIADMNFEQLKAYFKSRRITKSTTK